MRACVSSCGELRDFLFGPLTLLVAGLWAHGLACLAAVVVVGVAAALYLPELPSWTIPVGAVWGLFTPELLERKYLRSGWLMVDPQTESSSTQAV